MPRRAAATCMMIAMRLASATTQSRSYLKLAPACEVGAPVAGVHVADADEKRRPGEGPQLPPETSRRPAAPPPCYSSPSSDGWVWLVMDGAGSFFGIV